MLKHFSGKFLRGFFALLPFLLSIYIFIWLVQFAEKAASEVLLIFLPDQVYIPGLGIFVAVILIYMFGNLIDKPIARHIFRWVEEPFQIVPVVKSVYQAIKDFTSYLSPSQKRDVNRVVLVKLPGTDLQVIGLVTREALTDLPAPLGSSGRVAVYLPMSYQFGGYTIFVTKDCLQEINLTTEQAMRSVLTAWVSGVNAEPRK